MKKQEIALLKDAVGTIKSGVDLLKKLVDTPDDSHEEPQDEQPAEQEEAKPQDTEELEKIEFLRAMLKADEVNHITMFFLGNSMKIVDHAIIPMELMKELAKLYLETHEQ